MFETATKNKIYNNNNKKIRFFGTFFLVGWGPEFLLVPRPLQKRDFSKNSGQTPQRRQTKKVAQRKRGSDEPKHSQKNPRWRRVTR